MQPPSQPVEGEARASQVLSLGDPESEVVTSSNPTPFGMSPSANGTASGDTASSLKAVAAQLAGTEPDGAVVHTIAVSRTCFKIGRITVPPALVFAANGMTGSSGYSAASPHPEWIEAKKIIAYPMGGSPRKLRAFLSSGWKDVPDGQKWWEDALGPEVEEKRLKNLVLIDALRRGIESAGGL